VLHANDNAKMAGSNDSLFKVRPSWRWMGQVFLLVPNLAASLFSSTKELNRVGSFTSGFTSCAGARRHMHAFTHVCTHAICVISLTAIKLLLGGYIHMYDLQQRLLGKDDWFR
jgi:hypothetical protein